MSIAEPETRTARPFPRHAGWWIAWAILLASLAALLTWRALRSNALERQRADHAVQMELVARYAVAVRPLAEGMGRDPTAGRRLQDSIDSMARSEADKLRAAIAASELISRDAGAQRLREIARQGKGSQEANDAHMLHMHFREIDLLEGPPRDALVARYGWFGRLALSNGLPEADPLRMEVMAAASRTMAAVLTLVLGAGVMLLAGLALAVVAVVHMIRRRLRWRFAHTRAALPRRSWAWLSPMAVFLASFLAAAALAAWAGNLSASARWVTMTALLVSVPVALAWPLLSGATFREWRMALGLTGNPLREVPLGVVGYVAGLPLTVTGILITAVLIKVTGVESSHPIINETSRSAGSVTLLYLLACVWAPVTEELLFRGAFYAHLRQTWGVVVSAVVTGVIFAAIHPQGWVAVPALGSLAAVMALIREWRGSIYGCMAAHGVNNAAVLTLLVLGTG